jgi:hypothetical protein
VLVADVVSVVFCLTADSRDFGCPCNERLCRFDDDKDDGKVQAFCKKCVFCALWCCEKFTKWASKNAYIEIAIWGDNFCKSGLYVIARRKSFTSDTVLACRVLSAFIEVA